MKLRRSIFAGLTVAAATTVGAMESGFDELVINTGFYADQVALAANLTNDGNRHIVLAGRDNDHEQRLAVYAIGGAKERDAQLVASLSPGPNLIAYDVGRLGGRDGLFFIEPSRILRYNLATKQFVTVVDIRTIYGQERAGGIVPIDFFRDVNQDDRDDLIVSDTAGYRVRLQLEDGSLGDEILLQQSSSMTVSRDIVSFQSRPLFSADMNFDDLTDLAVWRGDSLRLYAQLPGARFESQPQIVRLGLDLMTEAEMRALQTNRGEIDQRELTEKRILSIEDLNNDQLPDILTESTFSEGVFDKRNEFRLHLGHRENDRIVYRKLEDALLASEGLQFGLISTDIDGDGKKDLVVRKVRMSFARVIKALLSGNVSLQLHFFKMTDDDDYAEDANYVAKTSVRFSVTSGQVDIPAIKVADFDGDGLQDLMMQTHRGRLGFYHGIQSEQLFDKDATVMRVVLPRNGELVSAEDIDGDGKADLVIRYNAADGNSAAQVVRLLLAN